MLKLMTFNVRYGLANDGANSWPLRRHLVAQTIIEQDADIIGLQEVQPYQLIELLEEIEGYDAVGVPRGTTTSDDEACTILYKHPLRLLSSETFWLSETPDEPGSQSWETACTRICTVAAFDGLTVYNTHLDHVSQEARVNGLKLISTRISGPSAVMGDFNASESNETHAALSGMAETYRKVHPDGPEVSSFHGWQPEILAGEKIDYIYVTHDVEILDADVLQQTFNGRAASDHFAVTASIAL